MTLTTTQTDELAAFPPRSTTLVHSHPVVVDNAYTQWFAKGDASADEVRHLDGAVQRVQPPLRRGAAAQGHQRRRHRDLPRRQGDPDERARRRVQASSADAGAADGVDLDLVSTEGTVDGGRFKFAAAHFEWLLRFAKPLGLEFADLGKRRHGTDSTLFFCDELLRIYGSEDASTPRARQLRGRALGRRRVLEGAHRRAHAFKERECSDAAACVLDLARQGRGPARRAHAPTSWPRRSSCRASTRQKFLQGRARDARRREGVLGRPRGRPSRRPDRDRADMVATHTPLAQPARAGTLLRRLGPPRVLGRQCPAGRRGSSSSAFGFTVTAYAGPETGVTDRVS